MKFKMIHENYNVYDLEKSMAFYEKALGLTERRRIEAEDGSLLIQRDTGLRLFLQNRG